MDFKDRLHELREETGMSITKFAGLFDKSEGAVRMWENGRSKPDADTLVRVAEYLDCTTDYLLGTSEYRNHEEQESIESDLGELVKKVLNHPVVERIQLLEAFTSVADSLDAFPEESEQRAMMISALLHITDMINRASAGSRILSNAMKEGGDENKRATAHYAISEMDSYQLGCYKAVDGALDLLKEPFRPYYNTKDKEHYSRLISDFNKRIDDNFAKSANAKDKAGEIQNE